MKLEELLKVATGTTVAIENEGMRINANAETMLRNLTEEIKNKKVKKVRIQYGGLLVLIADESEADRNG